MSWLTQTRGSYTGHFIDGYFRDEDAQINGATVARQQERTAAPLVFGAVTRFRRYGPSARSQYAALAAEFGRDPNPSYLTWMLITSHPSDAAHRFVTDLIRNAHFTVKEESGYADYAAFKRDADVLLGRVLSIFAAPIDLSVGLLQAAALDIVGVVTARGSP